MYKNELDYTANLKLIDDITSKEFKQYEVGHRKTYSQPDQVQLKRQPDRLEISINQSITLQMYPSIFKYIKIKVKELTKPLNFVYESNNNQCLIKIFVSSITDSPNILNNSLQVINKSRFQFTEPPSHFTKFKCDYVYLSIYTDKYTDLKIKATVGVHQSNTNRSIQKSQQTPILQIPRELLTTREPGSYTYRSNFSLMHKPKTSSSFIRSNKESQVKFKLILDFKIKSTKQKNSLIEEMMKKKSMIQHNKKLQILESSYTHEIDRLQSRVQRLRSEIKLHISNIDMLWLEILFITLLAKAIKHQYYKRVMRIVISNKVQVCCRKFMRIMLNKISSRYQYGKKEAVYLDTNILFYFGAKLMRCKAKQRAYSILNHFLYRYGHLSNGMNKMQQFNLKIKYIQQKWKTFKKSEANYLNRVADQIIDKWGILYREIIVELQNAPKSAPTQDKRLLLETISENLNNYKRAFLQLNNIFDKLASGATVFRPMNNIIMKDIMHQYVIKKANKLQ
ncbi:unnamed protein product [Paramecium pentaurelia]|uniref:Uncharacterized protein n=1 Tax=Paramecium pentaurelia TaxID=43138 RepID=A0A8S1TVY9_9CILI|nr:unnamed protein product [Paramecium pentaurelia]